MIAPVVVIGDVMLDVDTFGRSERMSPEAPVPVLQDLVHRHRAGGAALAAMLATRGTRPVVLIAPLADDVAAEQIRSLLDGRVELVALPWTGTTPVKNRLRAGDHPVARLDSGGDPGAIGDIPARVHAAIASAAAVLVSDYGRGAAADPALRELIGAATGRLPVVWDPHPKGADPVPGTRLVTPNEAELRHFVPTGDSAQVGSTGSVGAIRRAAGALRRRWQVGAVCVTLGARGAMLCVDDQPPFVAAGSPINGADTCGAGDCFAAAATLALADGALPSEAVTRAVAEAGRFVAAGGAAAYEPHPGSEAVETVPGDLETVLAGVRRAGGVVVATGGCFDLLHAGHVTTLQAARALGDVLVVCVNSDDSVRRLKGPQRPLQSASDRVQVLSALQSVDAVVVFEEDTPSEVIRRIRPDIWAKGGDYAGVRLPEADVLAEWGGEVVTVPYLSGRSTSALVALAGQPATVR